MNTLYAEPECTQAWTEPLNIIRYASVFGGAMSESLLFVLSAPANILRQPFVSVFYKVLVITHTSSVPTKRLL